MITYSLFGSRRRGNLGNQLFQLASMIGLSKKYNQELRMPNWAHRRYFNGLPYIISQVVKGHKHLPEAAYHYTPEHWDQLATGNWDVDGWLQSEKMWEHAKDDVKSFFTWNANFLREVQYAFKGKDLSNSIAISVRRGDYVGNINYDLLPVSYYMQALMQEFPDWLDREIVIFSDDIPYCKIHFEGLPNVTFVEQNAIVQLCLMSQCGGFIIANSTFSWWGAYLAELRDPSVKIVRPKYLFAGPLLAGSDSKDHWPDRWVVFDHKENGAPKKYDLRDVTFTIPVMHDHVDRKQNLDLNVCLLQRAFDTNVAIFESVFAYGEKDPKFQYMEQYCKYQFAYNEVFFRTWMLNSMMLDAETPIVANWDADVAVPEVQIMVAVELIRRDRMDGVYPYDGRFARVNRKEWFSKLEKELDLGIYKSTPFKGSVPSANSVGGAVIWNKAKYCAIGGENEKFISHAPEDVERWNRAHMLDLRIFRVNGQLFHMDHWVGPNSSNRHGHKPHNDKVWGEFLVIRERGNKEEMWEYVKSWPWYNGMIANSHAETQEWHDSGAMWDPKNAVAEQDI